MSFKQASLRKQSVRLCLELQRHTYTVRVKIFLQNDEVYECLIFWEFNALVGNQTIQSSLSIRSLSWLPGFCVKVTWCCQGAYLKQSIFVICKTADTIHLASKNTSTVRYRHSQRTQQQHRTTATTTHAFILLLFAVIKTSSYIYSK